MDSPFSSLRAPADSRSDAENPSNQSSPDAVYSCPAPTCCLGIDQPGVGRVHSPHCVHAGEPMDQSKACAKQSLPEPLRSLLDIDDALTLSPADVVALDERERNALLAQLVFAARDLAERNLLPAHQSEISPDLNGHGWCRECQMTENNGALVHGSTCATGRVLKIIAQLLALATPGSVLPIPHEKEAATDGETGCADDGIRPRGLSERVCMKCGARDGNWDAEQRPEVEVDLRRLALNQCVSAGLNGKDHTLYTHRCKVPEETLREVARKLVDEMLANKAQVSEIDRLARQLADDGAAANLEGCLYLREAGGYEWMVLADEDLVDCERELRYLDLRGVLVRNPDDKHLVRIDWTKGSEQPTEDVGDDPSRCAVCGWPMKNSRDEGCVRGDCSLRPRPDRLYAPERAAAESAAKGGAQ